MTMHIRLVALVFSALLLGGCDGILSGLNGMVIQNVQPGKKYVGFYDNPPPFDRGYPTLPEHIVVSYQQVPLKLEVFLNGNPIGQYFTLGREQATAKLADFKHFLREGENHLQAQPMALGPNVKFIADTQGPQIVVKEVCIQGDLLCHASANETQVRLAVTDSAKVSNVRFEGNPAYKVNGLYQAIATVSSDNIYEISAMDENGYKAEVSYLKDGASIPELFKARITLDAITNMGPIISEAMSGQVITRDQLIAGGMTDKWMDAGNLIAAILWVKVDELQTGTGKFISIEDSGDPDFPLRLKIDLVPGNGKINGMDFRGQTAGSCKHIRCQVWRDRPSQPDDPSRAANWMSGPNNMNVSARSVLMDIEFYMGVDDGRLSFELDNASDMDLVDTSGSLGPLAQLNMMEPIIINVVENVIQNTVSQVGIQGALTNETGQRFDLTTRAERISYDKLRKALDVTFSGKMDMIEAHPDVRRSLGSLYNKSEVPSWKNNPDGNMSVVLNSNIVNQALNAIYSMGMTHMSVMLSEAKMRFGPNAIDNSMGAEGDIKVDLVPSSPGSVRFDGHQVSQKASIHYNDAEMVISVKRDGKWQPKFIVNANLSVGAFINAVDSELVIKLDGKPRLNINSVLNDTGLPLTKAVVAPMLDVALSLIMPQVAKAAVNLGGAEVVTENELPLNIEDIFAYIAGNAEGVDLTGELPVIHETVELIPTVFDTHQQHLRFGMNVQPKQ